jgi:hypothetical protein
VSFNRKRCYALLNEKIAQGALPKGDYRFVVKAEGVKPLLNNGSLNQQQNAELNSVIRRAGMGLP